MLEIFDIEIEPVDIVHGDREYFYEVFLPEKYGYFPDGEPEPRIVVHDEWHHKIAFDGTPDEMMFWLLGID